MIPKVNNLLFLFIASIWMPRAVAQPVPLWRAHAHNDYVHDMPLLDALAHGIGSVEVDIHLVDGNLLVAHDADEVVTGRTLENLYLEPLRRRIRAQGGSVYPEAGALNLLIDIKTEAEATYAVLKDVLKKYEEILTRFEGDTVVEGAVTAIISGNRPRETMLAEPVRLAAYDGRLEDLGRPDPLSAAFMPLVSSNWMQIARWYGQGMLPEASKEKLLRVVKQAHDEGRKIRFWATTDNPRVWEVLYEAGVDLLNADDLDAVQAFLLEKKGK